MDDDRDFALWMKTRYLLKNLDDDTLHSRQNELLDVLGGLRRILNIFVDSLPSDTLSSLCDLLYPPSPKANDNFQLNKNLASLPDEMLHLICNHLNVIDLKNLQQTSCQFAIITGSEFSMKPGLDELNNPKNNLLLKCSIGFKQEILSLMQSDNINTKFLHLSSLISNNINNYSTLIKQGIIGKLVEFIKYDNKKCNFRYKYESMKILIELISFDSNDKSTEKRPTNNHKKYLEEILFQYDVLSAFHNLCKSDPVSKLLHYTSSSIRNNNHFDAEEIDQFLSLNKNDRAIMETDNDIISAYRWDSAAKRWRENGLKGRVCVYQNIQTGMHKLMYIISSELTQQNGKDDEDGDNIKLLQYIDNQVGVRWNLTEYSIYWRGDDYCMHTNGTWKLKFDINNNTTFTRRTQIIQQAIQLYDIFNTYSHRDNQTVGAKIMGQLESNNIFDHFYWITLPLQQQILNILQSDVPKLNEKGLKLLYHSILYIKKNNRNDEIQHIIGCGVIYKIVKFINPYHNNYKLVSYSIKILLTLLDLEVFANNGDAVTSPTSDHLPSPTALSTLSSSNSTAASHIPPNSNIIDEHNLMDVFYRLLTNINEESEVLQDVIEWFAAMTTISERRHEAIKVGALSYIFDNVLEYDAIIQSISVQTIYLFFSNFNNLDFAMINEETMQKIPNVLVVLLEKSSDYDDLEMQQQLLLTIEAFCDGTKSENRSRIILNSGCLKYIGILLNESIKYSSPKKNFDIESSCIRIIGNVLCDCIWSDFEDKTMECLDNISYLQIIHKLFNHTKLCRDILWSLSNVLISNKGISWIVTYEPIIIDIVVTATNDNDILSTKLQNDAGWSLCNAFRHSTSKQKLILLKCGFIDALLALIKIDKFQSQQIQKITYFMEKIVKSTVVTNTNKNNDEEITQQSQIYVSQLKYILEQKGDAQLLKNLKKILDIIQSGFIG